MPLSHVRYVTLGIDGLLVLSSTSDLMFLGTRPKPIKLNRNAKDLLALNLILYDKQQEWLEVFNPSRRSVNGKWLINAPPLLHRLLVLQAIQPQS